MSDIQEQIKIAHRKALEQDFNEIIKELKQEEHKNLELSMRINKAIEYIKENIIVNTIFQEDENDLINILQGSDKE
jgi:hypothetical protein